MRRYEYRVADHEQDLCQRAASKASSSQGVVCKDMRLGTLPDLHDMGPLCLPVPVLRSQDNVFCQLSAGGGLYQGIYSVCTLQSVRHDQRLLLLYLAARKRDI